MTAEEQDIDKNCSERKACRRKWLATLFLSSSRHECASHDNLVVRAQMGWNKNINDFATTTQFQVSYS